MNIKTKAGAAITVFGVLYSGYAYMMPRAAIGNPMAPMIFPMILGIGLIVLGGVYFLKEYAAWKAQVARDGVKSVTPEEAALEKKTNKLILLTCFSGIAYAMLFNGLGYVISTALFIGVIMFGLNGKDKWKLNLAVALIFSIAVYFIFSNLLAIPLPRMPILDI